jgi:hypothetical protein
VCHRYGFEVLGFRTIEASTGIANAASVWVLEKLRMLFRHRTVLGGLNTVFYTLQRDASRRPTYHPLNGSVEARLSDRFPVRRLSAFAERGRRLGRLPTCREPAMSGHLARGQVKHLPDGRDERLQHEDLP